jgi:hypothetical protein
MPGYATVANDIINNSSGGGFYGIPATTLAGLSGPYACIQHSAAAELSTTEYASLLTYAVGAPLTGVSSTASTAADRGKVRTLKTAATDVIIGYVAGAATFTGPEGYSTLAFTPAYVNVGSTATIASDIT